MVKKYVFMDKFRYTPCDADCLAWLEEKAPRNMEKYRKLGKEEEFKEKVNYVLSRLHSQRARNIAKSYVEQLSIF